jgi:hypothetical protein
MEEQILGLEDRYSRLLESQCLNKHWSKLMHGCLTKPKFEKREEYSRGKSRLRSVRTLLNNFFTSSRTSNRIEGSIVGGRNPIFLGQCNGIHATNFPATANPSSQRKYVGIRNCGLLPPFSTPGGWTKDFTTIDEDARHFAKGRGEAGT